MRLPVTIGLLLASFGCEGSSIEARWPVVDRFPKAFAVSEERRPPPAKVHSISLGFIGDQPIGVEPTTPYHEPYWERPFPCHWTHTCWCGGPAYVPYATAYAVRSASSQ
ncbi:MAG TPA: hypothetical protein VGY54_19490 [Polyangiaceae bacterium]|jgi:hypothetical protein|nr:hypothetical protein [Polyangiaceae bacterium]